MRCKWLSAIFTDVELMCSIADGIPFGGAGSLMCAVVSATGPEGGGGIKAGNKKHRPGRLDMRLLRIQHTMSMDVACSDS
jgi:hypothetical protein